MKKSHLPAVLLVLCIITAAPNNLMAQCTCNQPDPFGYSSTSCGLQDITILGSSSTCLSNSCNASSGAYQYDIYFVSNTVTGYAYSVTGGVVSMEVITRGNGMPPVTRQNCLNYGQYGSVNYLNHVTLKINWTTASASNCLLIWGYTGGTSFPAYLTYFKLVPVSTNTLPSAPTAMSVSSPTSYPTCGWKMYCSYISNADTYTWTGAANITTPFYSGGATVAENQNAYLCVKANNACGSSSTYCTTVSIPNNPMCGSRMAMDPPADTDITGLSTKNSFSNKEIIITPNPAKDNLTIYTGMSEIRSIELFTVSGQLVQRIAPTGNKRQDINISSLQRGIYLVLIHQANGPDFKKMIVVQ